MAEVQVILPVTLHARPAALLVAAANKAAAKVKIGYNGRFVEAKSLLSIISLGASAGAEVTLQAEGPGAEESVAALQQVIAGLHE